MTALTQKERALLGVMVALSTAIYYDGDEAKAIRVAALDRMRLFSEEDVQRLVFKLEPFLADAEDLGAPGSGTLQ